MNFSSQYDIYKSKVDYYLNNCLKEKNKLHDNIYKAMKYSIDAGGKRLRPVLSLCISDIIEGNFDDVIDFACAVEMIHTYSLIHDDLPCMDNDDYRRGKLTSHKVFGEDLAVLAGDALLNFAFEIMISKTIELLPKNNNSINCIQAMKVIAQASGADGMIGGQTIDIDLTNKKVSEKNIKKMHELKTGALIKAAVIAPAYLFGADNKIINSLDIYSTNIGLAFQIKDDILDIESNIDIMGKESGSDEKSGKTTYISLYGITKSKKILSDVTNKAIDAIEVFGDKAQFLRALALYIQNREN